MANKGVPLWEAIAIFSLFFFFRGGSHWVRINSGWEICHNFIFYSDRSYERKELLKTSGLSIVAQIVSQKRLFVIKFVFGVDAADVVDALVMMTVRK